MHTLRISVPFLLLLVLLTSTILSAQLSLQLGQLPDNTPPGSTIYVAGDFNNWQPDNTDYTFQTNETGTLELVLDNLAAGTYTLKLTRGSWSTVEGDENGNYRPNRSISYNGTPTSYTLDVLSWEDLGGSMNNSTAAANVQVLSPDFELPQLESQRRIWLYLPPDYDSSGRSYPVLYMHDGQNLFDATTSFSGEWEVDETLNALHAAGDPGIIVVGIDNGGASRIAEYTPWPNPQYGGGQGAAYVDFLAQTLKPYIDTNYRTLPDAAHTGIMGSSLGGLISLYASLRHPDIFGRAGILSPSLWFSEDIYHYADTVAQVGSSRMYFLAGGSESSSIDVIGDVNRFVSRLEAVNYPALTERVFHPEGTHAEWYWAREFGAAYQWLFREVTTLDQHQELAEVEVFPNPVQDTLYFDQLPNGPWIISVFNTAGKLETQLNWDGKQIDVSSLSPGIYFAVVKNAQEQWLVARFVKI